jgi:hypothetical protein
MERSSGMKNILPVLAFATAAAVFAAPAMACERHQSHEAINTVEAIPAPPAPALVKPAPTVVIEPAAQSAPGSEIKAESAMSLPLGAAYENCRRKNTTVYLTQ